MKYYEKGVREIADPLSFDAVKMDGAKSRTDIADLFNRVSGREACCEGRKVTSERCSCCRSAGVLVRECGPCSKEDPAGSSIQAK